MCGFPPVRSRASSISAASALGTEELCARSTRYCPASRGPGSFAISRGFRRAQSRRNSWTVWSKVTSVTRSSNERDSREAKETAMIAAMNIAPILSPSGRSTMLGTVV
jgi:hypothetical protein